LTKPVASRLRVGRELCRVLRTNLRSPVPRHRVLALRGSVRQNLATPDDWRSALSDADVHVRREALNQIAHVTFDDDAVFAALVHCLDDDDALVVDGASSRSASTSTLCVEKMCVIATSHEDARCRESAIAALGAIGDDRARPAILAALNDKPRCADAPSSHSRTSRDPTSTRRWRAPVRTVTGSSGGRQSTRSRRRLTIGVAIERVQCGISSRQSRSPRITTVSGSSATVTSTPVFVTMSSAKSLKSA